MMICIKMECTANKDYQSHDMDFNILKVSYAFTLYVYRSYVLNNSFNIYIYIYMQLSSGASCLNSDINLHICPCSHRLI